MKKNHEQSTIYKNVTKQITSI